MLMTVDPNQQRSVTVPEGEFADALIQSTIGRYLGVTVVDDAGDVAKQSPLVDRLTRDDCAIQHASMILDNVDEFPGQDGAVKWPRDVWDDAVVWLQRVAPGITITSDAVTFLSGETVHRLEPDAAV